MIFRCTPIESRIHPSKIGPTFDQNQTPAAAGPGSSSHLSGVRITRHAGRMTITLDELYPDASEEERADAGRRLAAYLRVVLEIMEEQRRGAVDDSQERADNPDHTCENRRSC